MDRELAARAHAIFARALEANRSERQAIVSQACGTDAALRSQVNRLLDAADASDGFLETPALASLPGASLEVPDAVGNYLVIGVLGVGGMATVYEAVQESPDRHVALKVMHQTMSHTDAILRFRLEAQTLARLHHPGIAQIFEAGTAPLGRATPSPFFAMELIPQALSITEFADRHKLTLRERLTMFASVCDAVMHGHQNGIIHRDLKPANILVGPDGHAKVIDFGIARSTDVGSPSMTAAIDGRKLIGTLNAMSPEQCIDPASIDIRSDVYSLGVILYELVTGRPPHDLSRCSIPQAVRIITEQRPPRASSIRAEAKGDLDAIIAMAMELDRDRRYVGAGALAADIRRYLSERPVEARASTTIEQLVKFTRRNPPLATAIGAALVLLVGGVVVSARLAYVAAQARDAAIEGQHELETVIALQESMLSGLDVWEMGDKLRRSLSAAVERSTEQSAADEWTRMTRGVNFTSLAVRSLSDSILLRYQRSIDEQLANQPELHARLLHRLVITMTGLGLHADAEPIARRAFEIRRESLGADHEDTILSLMALGTSLSMLGRYDESIATLTDAWERSTRARGPFNEMTLRGQSALAGVYRRQGNLVEAERLWTQALADQRRELGVDHADTLRTLNNVGLLYAIQGKLDRAEQCWREALDRRRRIYGEQHSEYLGSLGNLGMLLVDLGRFDEARPLLEQALEHDRRVRGDLHPSTLTSMVQLAALLQDTGDLAAAEVLVRECVNGRSVKLGPEHAETLNTRVFLAALRSLQGDSVEAEEIMRHCLAIQRRTLGEGHMDTMYSMTELRDLLRDTERLEQAIELSSDLIEVARSLTPPNPFEVGKHLSAHGQLLLDAGRTADAHRALVESVQLLTGAVGSEHPQTRTATERLTASERATNPEVPGAKAAPPSRSE